MENMRKPIVLVGMSGSGKSSIGKNFAKILNKSFFDLDREIEKNLNLKINEIFKIYGENYFRKKEHKNLIELIKKENSVIALGGGAFCQKRSSKIVKSCAISIWIDTDINVIYKRLNGNNNRPLLKGLVDSRLKERIIEIYQERYKCYSIADLRIKLSNKPLTKSVSITLNKLENYFNQEKSFGKKS